MKYLALLLALLSTQVYASNNISIELNLMIYGQSSNGGFGGIEALPIVRTNRGGQLYISVNDSIYYMGLAYYGGDMYRLKMPMSTKSGEFTMCAIVVYADESHNKKCYVKKVVRDSPAGQHEIPGGTLYLE